MSALDLGPRYERIRELGSGGMGRVFLVRDRHAGRELALKVLEAPLDPSEVERFREEFALLARIDHPGIARAHDFGCLGDRPFFTSEYVPGEVLGEDGRPRDLREVLAIAADLAEALAFLHRHGVLHLDVKPGNIILRDGSGRRRAVLIDFGLFRQAASPPPDRLRGSAPYMAPERFRGEIPGPPTDVYSLGVTLYRLATGRFPRPPSGEERWTPSPPPPSSLDARLPADLDRLVLRCLALDPRSRFRDGGELLEALKTIDGAVAAEDPGVPAFVRTIGRSDELAAAGRFLDGFAAARSTGRGIEAAGPSPFVLLVTGQPGMGQTHLLREIGVRAETRGLRFYLEAGYAGRPGGPALLFRSLLSHLPAAARSRLQSFLARQGDARRPARGEATEEERRLRRTEELSAAIGALEDPLLLAVDGLQWFDEVSILLVADLIRIFGQGPGAARPPLGLILGYREEGTAAALLREMTASLLRSGSCAIASLRPLGPEEALELYRGRGGTVERDEAGLGIYQETLGSPARIVALAAGRGELSPCGAPRAVLPSVSGRIGGPPAAGLRPEARRLLLSIALLRRPVRPAEIEALAGIHRAARRRIAASLLRAGLLEVEAGGDFLPGAGATEAVLSAAPEERRRMHGRIARELARRLDGDDDPALWEIVEHARAAGDRRLFARHALPLARRLRSTFRSRAALDLYRALLEGLPWKREGLRLSIALEISDLHGRLGSFDEGIRLLRSLLDARKDADPCRTRLLLKLAALHSRQGDFRRADALFREGLDAARKGKGKLRREEFLPFLEEHAAFKAFVGDPAKALDLCREGLALCGKGRSFRMREIALSFHATRGTVALRGLDLAEAVRSFEKALGIADAIGSLAVRATVLNNLGIAYAHGDRPSDAIRAFREARETCLAIDEGPSLTFLHGNLAVLHAKRGDFVACEKELEEAGRMCGGGGAPGDGPGAEAGKIGRRQSLFLAHHRGLSHLYRGRFAEARAHLESALRQGDAVGDRLLASFDAVFRAECLVFEGIYSEALRELERLSAEESPAPVRRMALARLAFLDALAGRHDAVRAAAGRRGSVRMERAVPFLDSWDGLFLGWALSIAGAAVRARAALLPVERYFRLHGYGPAADLAAWVRAESFLLEGEAARAREVLEEVRGEGGLAGILRPLLAARLALEGAPGKAERERAADLLAEAGAASIGNPLPEWSLRIDALRAAGTAEGGACPGVPPAARPGTAGGRACTAPGVARRGSWVGAGRGAVEGERVRRKRKDLAGEVPRSARLGYLRGKHWKAWTSVSIAPGNGAAGGEAGPEPAGAPARREETSTRALSGEASALRSRLVVRSPPMRRLAAMLDRLRGADLPVLITGERGTGKEVVARIIHGESRRFAGPFLVVDLATIPAPLIEVELFGARAGAYTDLKADRPGILLQAAGGTVLVDEVCEASLESQAKLLRVIAEKRFRPVGAETETPLDVRFLFSSSRDLEREVREGRFREDLLLRMRLVTIEVPPLRDRPEDLPDLVRALLEDGKGPAPAVGRPLLDRLLERPWPGNVRELKNLLARLKLENPLEIPASAVDSVPGAAGSSMALPRSVLAGSSLAALKDRVERDYILHHLERLAGDTAALGRFLGISRKHLYRRCSALGIRLRGPRRPRSPS